MPQLILTEKPDVAERIANALGKAKLHNNDGVRFYEVDGNYVVPAVGHIYGLTEKKQGFWTYPVFDIHWAPSHTINKTSSFTKKYLENIKEISKKCDEFINACDYDIEGEVIGYNVLKHACKIDPLSKNAKRMKYSTLTAEAIKKSYSSLQKPDAGMANAGLARHVLDWYWGINLSRALSLSMKTAGQYTTLSIGRVQGPTLHVLAEREKQIKAFEIKPYWIVELYTKKDKIQVKALHTTDKFWEHEQAKKVKARCGKKAVIDEVKRNKFSQKPPYPFDLTTLQTEAYRLFKIDPRKTLEIAQSLYTQAYISYPRTASQKLPDDIDFKQIIANLAKLGDYKDLSEKLLSLKTLTPANGKKDDPAHPAIHPTGERIHGLDGQSGKIFDLVVKRFFATFGESAKRETVSVKFNNNSEVFIAKGTTTTFDGWHEFYKPYVKLEENLLPTYKEGEGIVVDETLITEKETKPPARYTPASIVREMEKREIGTKATRATIMDILYRRGYITGEKIEVTDLGLSVVETLDKYCPEVVSEELTRKFERQMQDIVAGKTSKDKIVSDGRKTIEKISIEFKSKEKDIGRSLLKPFYNAQRMKESLGDCHKCDGMLLLRKSRQGTGFIGCSNYPECTYTVSLPKEKLKRFGKCKTCGYGMLQVQVRKPWRFCVNPECPSKKRVN